MFWRPSAKINGKQGIILRCFHPDSISVEVLVGEETIPAQKLDSHGIFWIWMPGEACRGNIRSGSIFMETSLGRLILHIVSCPRSEIRTSIISAKVNITIFTTNWEPILEIDGVTGVAFAVWAPNAKRVSLIGDFNNWDGRVYPMRSMGASGIWELFVPGLDQGGLYKYEIKTNSDELRIKTDPFAFDGTQA